MKLKILTIVGARPQFIKAAAVSRLLKQHAEEIIVHTGQHYDENLSKVFFDELEIPTPNYNLDVGSGSHGVQTGEMLAKTEAILLHEKPDRVLVYGDTNSTLAGALAAAKLNLKLAHIESGLRSFNRRMPEEINRILTDHMSDLLFCPSEVALQNLQNEGITQNVYVVGDVMAESLAFAAQKSAKISRITDIIGVRTGEYYLATLHRAENTDHPERLANILRAFSHLEKPVILPLHPRTKQAIEDHNIRIDLSEGNITIISPVGYLDMVQLERSAKMILTDSGGIQKEAYWLKVPCVTLRDETEWVETVNTGWNVLAGGKEENIVDIIRNFTIPHDHPELYGDGHAAQRIVDRLFQHS
jgi:UDP-GlcNAc3NAcA epimerase